MQFTIKHKQIWLRWLPVIFFAVAIFVFSSITGEQVDDSFRSLIVMVKSRSPAILRVFLFSSETQLKIGHGIGYFCLGFTVLYVLTPHSRWSPLAALVICSLYAIADEFHQTFTPGRSAEAQDVLLDSLASLAGILFLLGIMKWRDDRKFREVQTRSE